MKFILVALSLTLVAGCGLKVSMPGCTDQLNACGQKIIDCTQQAHCDVSACYGGVLPTPVPTP